MLVLWPEDAIGVAMMNDSGSLNLEYTGTNRPTTTNARRSTVRACMHDSKAAFPTNACRKLFVSGHCRCGDRQIVSLESRRHFSIRLKSLEWSRKDGMNLARDGLWDSAEGVTSRHRHLFTSKCTCAICTMQLKAL